LVDGKRVAAAKAPAEARASRLVKGTNNLRVRFDDPVESIIALYRGLPLELEADAELGG
jgi:hypothetical protein